MATAVNGHNRVLIVDDDIALCKELSTGINKAGTTCTANGGQAALGRKGLCGQSEDGFRLQTGTRQ